MYYAAKINVTPLLKITSDSEPEWRVLLNNRYVKAIQTKQKGLPDFIRAVDLNKKAKYKTMQNSAIHWHYKEEVFFL